MYAVIETGGRQYKVAPGEVIEVNRLPVEVGQTIDLDQVLLVGGGEGGPLVGAPTVPGARVRAKVSGNPRSRKVIVFKYKSKVHYRRFNTHRQDLTRLVIKDILTGAEPEEAPVVSEAVLASPEPVEIEATTDVNESATTSEESENGA